MLPSEQAIKRQCSVATVENGHSQERTGRVCFGLFTRCGCVSERECDSERVCDGKRARKCDVRNVRNVREGDGECDGERNEM